ncbi:UNVERIFIED_CONTAM: hypothetical protein GTU68_029892 [Idotea baltica]|nr:hypothetical protein [Idotea baltica]
MEFIDTHTHLDAPDFDEDREEVIQRALNSGIKKLITIGAGYGFESAQRAVDLSKQYDEIYASIGVHPHDAKTEPDLSILENLINNKKVVAIGETGLDFFRDWAPKELQYKWFREQIKFAKKYNKPIIIHCRQTPKECFEVLKEEKAETVGGVFHCYSEDYNYYKEISKLNFKVSFPGILTFKNAITVHEAAKQIPLEDIMLETDAPYLAPTPYRGKRCESSYLVETAKILAEIKNLSIEVIAEKTTSNAIQFFGLN